MKCASRHFSAAYCVVCVVAITLLGAGSTASAQTASSTKAFEVATIKPAAPFDPTKFWAHISQTRVSYTYMTLKNLTTYAYGVKTAQVSGPEWIDSEHYDIEATFPDGAAKEDEPRMLQALLKERFKLAFHIEQRKLPAYALVVGKNGSKLRPSPPDSPAPDPNAPLKPGEKFVGEGDRKIRVTTNKDGSTTSDMGKMGTRTSKIDSESMIRHVEISKISMDQLAKELPAYMHEYGPGEHMVVDKTGITGFYQVAIDYPIGIHRPSRTAAGRDASDAIPPDRQNSGSLDRSLDALGLKLEKREVLMDVYVIDHVEMPSAN